ncbi:thiol-activated cytolysin family protein [Streptomyces sp. NPDC003042]
MLWPGALVQGGPAASGALLEVGVEDRTPIKISCTDTHLPDPSATIDDPSASAVRKAIAKMVSGQKGAAAATYFQMTDASTIQSALLEVDVSASYMGFDGHGSPPLYVASVTYGRSLIFAMTTKADSLTAKAAIRASYQGMGSVSGSVKAEYKKVLNESRLMILARGGSGPGIEKMIQEGTLNKYFDDSPALDDLVPMTYVLRTLDTGEIARMGETAKYSTVTRVKSGPPGTVHLTPTRLRVTMNAPIGPMALRLKDDYEIEGTAGGDRATHYPLDGGWAWPAEVKDGTAHAALEGRLGSTALFNFGLDVDEQLVREDGHTTFVTQVPTWYWGGGGDTGRWINDMPMRVVLDYRVTP